MTSEFERTVPFETRVALCKELMSKHEDRIPIIMQKKANAVIPDIDKKKYLVPNHLTVGQLVNIVRKRISLDSRVALILNINNKMFPAATCVIDIYETNKNLDGFLYIFYLNENVFG